MSRRETSGERGLGLTSEKCAYMLIMNIIQCSIYSSYSILIKIISYKYIIWLYGDREKVSSSIIDCFSMWIVRKTVNLWSKGHHACMRCRYKILLTYLLHKYYIGMSAESPNWRVDPILKGWTKKKLMKGTHTVIEQTRIRLFHVTHLKTI